MYLEFDTCEAAIVSFEGADALATDDVPQHHLAVAAGTHEAVILKAYRVHGTLVAIKGTMDFQCSAVPHADQRVFRADTRTD